MLSLDNLHDYQRKGVEYIKQKKNCALFLDMGLGKTVTTLTALNDILSENKKEKILIIAPLRVANTVWKQEAKKWRHLQHLKISICTGSKAERINGLTRKADIYVINRENIPWLRENYDWDFTTVVIDESSSFKSAKAKRFKALKSTLKRVRRMVLLTGTPSPNGIMDLWSQMFLIDRGERLGRTITGYRQRFFHQGGYGGYTYIPNNGAAQRVNELIQDVCLTMKAEDYLDMPERVDVAQTIELPDNVLRQYRELEKEFIIELQNNVNIETPNAAALAGKLLQMCNGAVYDEDKNYHVIHDEKIEALKEFVEFNPDENILVAYNYRSDLERIQKAFPHAVKLSRTGEEVDSWNNGQIKMLLAHPASAGHGLNIQKGGNIIVWFGLNWSLELYQQFNARLHRQGQNQTVRIIHLVADGGMDAKVMSAIESKAKSQDEMLEFLKKSLA